MDPNRNGSTRGLVPIAAASGRSEYSARAVRERVLVGGSEQFGLARRVRGAGHLHILARRPAGGHPGSRTRGGQLAEIEKLLKLNVAGAPLVDTSSTPKSIWPTVDVDGIQPLLMIHLNTARRSTVPALKLESATNAM